LAFTTSRLRSGLSCLIALAFVAAAVPAPSFSDEPSFEPSEVVLDINALVGGSAWSLTDGNRNRLTEEAKGHSKTALLQAPNPVTPLRRGAALNPAGDLEPPRNPSNPSAPSRAPPCAC
jgi:hypothetical protein